MVDRVPDLRDPRTIHLVGICGSGMSAIAAVLAEMGHSVTGSDAVGGPVADRLRALGVAVHVGHHPRLAKEAEIVAASTAIPESDPEVTAARRSDIRVWRRSELLAAICGRRRTIGVSGSHGKTTSASMLAVILVECGWHPSMIIGGDIAGLGPGARWDEAGDWLVVEADESDGTFLELGCEAVVVTSVSSDHAESFGGRDGLDVAFVRFLSDPPGPAVACADDPGVAAVAPRVKRELVTYGTDPDATVRIGGVDLGAQGSSFSLVVGEQHAGSVRLAVPGMHNVLNAVAALSAAAAIGVGWPEAIRALETYRGVARRFETRGVVKGITFVDDYAHNPEKVHAALATASNGGWSRIVAVFQPHRYSRTEALWREFGPPLASADLVVVTDVYAAGEAPRPGVTGELVADAVRQSNPNADVRYVQDLEEAFRLLVTELRSGDLCLTVGAGDITSLAGRLMEAVGV